MKRLLLLISIPLFLSLSAYANHIKGGFFTYQYLGPGTLDPNNAKYRVTLTVYMLCNPSSAQVNNPINFSIYAGNNNFIKDVSVSIRDRYQLGKASDEECITGNQQGCYYEIVIYELDEVELPPSLTGYIFSYQRCCRISGIQNISGNSAQVGNTFTINIPGTSLGLTAPTNSSPRFLINDTVVVCGGSYFEYSFKATDPNGDSLAYEFCDAFLGGDSGGGSAPNTASPPPYTVIPYQSPFSGTQPMGNQVVINPRTGLISGIAPGFPNTGEYVICVCVSEYDSLTGVFKGKTRKELHVRVGDCEPIRADLNPTYISCDDSTYTFFNNDNSSGINSWFWDFGVASSTSDTSILTSPTFTYPDTGIYVLKLIVNKGQLCTATDSAIVKVYPGFFPGFSSSGICYLNPVQFTDTTRTRYGTVNAWSWNFGDAATLSDTSHVQNPSWTYSSPGPKTITLIVSNSKGCIDTLPQTIDLVDKPPLTMGFKDTLICAADDIQLQATGTGNWSWTPLINIIGPNTSNPVVDPPSTTTYYVELENGGCRNRDSVKVRVITAVSVAARPDTTICQGDPVQLGAITDGLSYSWTPTATLTDPNILNPIATPLTTTTYQLQSTVGSCSSIDNVTIRVVPYPKANAGPDTVICYNTSAQLNGSHDGSSFTWTPVNYLSNGGILNPMAIPPRTTPFILSAFDTQGCPKPGRDTVLVTVLPRIMPFAGNDTSIIVGQPLQFNAIGGVDYSWSPAFGLSSTSIPNPVGTYDGSIDSIRYRVDVYNEAGCFDSAFITVKIFKTTPMIFVPSAFTPNNDGRNDLIRPIAVGIQKINYFRIFNRWGQMVFSTSTNGHGWDGRIGGALQGTNVFVWMVSAVDYLGKAYFQKGIVTLIR